MTWLHSLTGQIDGVLVLQNIIVVQIAPRIELNCAMDDDNDDGGVLVNGTKV